MKIAKMISELEKGMHIIQSLFADMPQDEACIRPDSENWSSLEVLCHLVDEEREDFREHLDQALHRQDADWHPIDPEGWVITRKYNQQDLKNKLAEFSEERKKSLHWLRRLDAMMLENRTTAPFGEISAGNLLAAWVMHDNLHIRQLVALRNGSIRINSSPYSVRYAGEW